MAEQRSGYGLGRSTSPWSDFMRGFTRPPGYAGLEDFKNRARSSQNILDNRELPYIWTPETDWRSGGWRFPGQDLPAGHYPMSPVPGLFPDVEGGSGKSGVRGSAGGDQLGSATQLPSRLGSARSHEPPAALQSAIGQAIYRTYGPGYSFGIRSGITSRNTGAGTSSQRHTPRSPGAADVQIFAPDGHQLAGKELTPLAKNWIANYGSMGINMAPGEKGYNFTHMDLVTNRGRLWGYPPNGGGGHLANLPKSMQDDILPSQGKGVWTDYTGNIARNPDGTPVPPADIPNAGGMSDVAAVTDAGDVQDQLINAASAAPPGMPYAPPPAPASSTDIVTPDVRARLTQELNALKNGPMDIPGITGTADAGQAGPNVTANMAMMPPPSLQGATMATSAPPAVNAAATVPGWQTLPSGPGRAPSGPAGFPLPIKDPAATDVFDTWRDPGTLDSLSGLAASEAVDALAAQSPGSIAPIRNASWAQYLPNEVSSADPFSVLQADNPAGMPFTSGMGVPPAPGSPFVSADREYDPIVAHMATRIRELESAPLFHPYTAAEATGFDFSTDAPPSLNMATRGPTSVPSTTYASPIIQPGYRPPLSLTPDVAGGDSTDALAGSFNDHLANKADYSRTGTTTGENFTPTIGTAPTNVYKPAYEGQINSAAYPPTLPASAPVTTTVPDANTTTVEKTPAPAVTVVPAANPVPGLTIAEMPPGVADRMDINTINQQLNMPDLTVGEPPIQRPSILPTNPPITQPAPPPVPQDIRPVAAGGPSVSIPAATRAPPRQMSPMDKAMAAFAAIYGSRASEMMGNTPGMQYTPPGGMTGSQQAYNLSNPNSTTYKPSNY